MRILRVVVLAMLIAACRDNDDDPGSVDGADPLEDDLLCEEVRVISETETLTICGDQSAMAVGW